MTLGWTRAVEGKESGCGAGCEDRLGTESTAEGQATQGRGVLSAAYSATVSRNQEAGMAISLLRRGVMFIFQRACLAWD